jgi:hypothetical protein
VIRLAVQVTPLIVVLLPRVLYVGGALASLLDGVPRVAVCRPLAIVGDCGDGEAVEESLHRSTGRVAECVGARVDGGSVPGGGEVVVPSGGIDQHRDIRRHGEAGQEARHGIADEGQVCCDEHDGGVTDAGPSEVGQPGGEGGDGPLPAGCSSHQRTLRDKARSGPTMTTYRASDRHACTRSRSVDPVIWTIALSTPPRRSLRAPARTMASNGGRCASGFS